MLQIERWGVFEIAAQGRKDGNPFLDYEITGRFTGAQEQMGVYGFYDGDGVYRVWFMPSYGGKYSYGALIAANDPYHHMCSIHNGIRYYDYSCPWITHLSLQRVDFYRMTEYTDEYLEKYRNPVVWDEICYEGKEAQRQILYLLRIPLN